MLITAIINNKLKSLHGCINGLISGRTVGWVRVNADVRLYLIHCSEKYNIIVLDLT